MVDHLRDACIVPHAATPEFGSIVGALSMAAILLTTWWWESMRIHTDFRHAGWRYFPVAYWLIPIPAALLRRADAFTQFERIMGRTHRARIQYSRYRGH